MKGRKTGGRQKGTPNRLTGAQVDLLNAWDKLSGPETSKQILGPAIQKAKEGDLRDLALILPYIARKMPETVDMNVSQFTPDALRNFVEEFFKRKP